MKRFRICTTTSVNCMKLVLGEVTLSTVQHRKICSQSPLPIFNDSERRENMKSNIEGRDALSSELSPCFFLLLVVDFVSLH
mmetsp:Transcript_62769/g.73025  ORF Transcript_62769/g.73025 Transcript_62769/m.73025 type:complete len:81 (+) Transcript_62769:89-331(+)